MKIRLSIKSGLEGLSIICLGGLAGFTGPVIFIILTRLTASLQPSYDPIRETISALAIGRYGWLETTVFFLFSALLLLFTIRLYLATYRGLYSKIGAVSFLLISLGFVLIGIFPTNELGTPETTSSLMHNTSAGGSSVLFAIACFSFALEFRTNPSWRKFFFYTLLTSIVAIILNFIRILAPSDWYWAGLHERILVANAFIWVAVISIRLLHSCICQWRSPYVCKS